MNPSRARRAASLDRYAQRRHRPDYLLLVLSVILLVVGLVVVYAISPGLAAQKDVGDNYYVNKQLIAILLGIGAFAVMAQIPVRLWKTAQRPLIIAAGVASLAVLLLGEEVNGATRWLQVGGLSFQAAELIKFALIVWLADFLYAHIQKGTPLDNYQLILKPLLVAVAVIGGVVAVLQSDLGSTMVMLAIIGAMVFVVGMPLKKVGMIAGVVAIGVILAIASSPYRRDRVFTFLNPEQDCLSTGYQACQALIAVGSGGMFGKGLAHSVQAYGYLPEAANDSIFAIYAEKFGFIGTAALLGVFVAFFSRLKRLVDYAPDTFSRLLATGILAWLSTQTIINIGAMIGLLPLKGITLPFISYGGTSLLFVTGLVGLAFQLSRYTSYSANIDVSVGNEGGRHDNSRDGRRFRGAYHPGVSGR